METGSFGNIFVIMASFTAIVATVAVAVVSGNFASNIEVSMAVGVAFGLIYGAAMASMMQRKQRGLTGVTADTAGQRLVALGYTPNGQVGNMLIYQPTSGLSMVRGQLVAVITPLDHGVVVAAPKRVLAKL